MGEITWQCAEIDGQLYANFINPNLPDFEEEVELGTFDILAGLSKEEKEEFTIPKKYWDLPILVNGIKCVIKKSNEELL